MRDLYAVVQASDTLDSEELKKNSTIVEILQKRAAIHPDQPAFCFLTYLSNKRQEHKLNFKQLDTGARKVAAYMQSLGLSGKRAILMYPDGLDFIVAFLGCLYAGVTAVPLYHFITRRKSDRMLSIIEDCDPQIFMSDSKRISTIKKFTDNQFSGTTFNWLTVEQAEEVNPDDFKPMNYQRDELAYLQYTSGSTSTPKGVMITHNNIMHNMDVNQWSFDLTQDSIGVSWIPHYHDMGLVLTILQPIYSGYRQVFMQPADFVSRPFRFLKAISDFKGTMTLMPNFAYEHCVLHATAEQKQELDLSSIVIAINGAEPVQYSTLEVFNQAFQVCGWKENAMAPAWGLAEVTLTVTAHKPTGGPVRVLDVDQYKLEQNIAEPAGKDSGTIRYCSVGAARADTQVVIVNPDTLTECPEGHVGELWVSSDSVAIGYWNKPESTNDTFAAYLAVTGEGPFMRTGDLGFVWEGQLYISGRIKDVIIIRGSNYYPNDIEFTAAHCHPQLVPNSCAAFAVTEGNQECLYIAQEIKRTETNRIDALGICDSIRKSVAEIHGLQVQGILLLRFGGIHKTSSGKVQRKQCKEAYLQGELDVLHTSIAGQDNNDVKEPSAELKQIEKCLLELVGSSTRIDCKQVRITSSMVTMGLDSMAMMMLKQKIEDMFLCQLELADLFNCTLAELACIIKDFTHSKEGSIHPLEDLAALGSIKDVESETFPLTELQNAYWMGRNEGFEIGGIAAHGYLEIKVKRMDVDHKRLNLAWQKIVKRHEMLRAMITSDGKQLIVDSNSSYDITYHDLSTLHSTLQQDHCEEITRKLSHQVIPLDTWPMFEIHHSKLGPQESILHFSIDLMIADIWSINLLFKEWYQTYVDLETSLNELNYTFRDYCHALELLKGTELYRKSEIYWKNRVEQLPQAPVLPLVKSLMNLGEIKFHHRSYTLPSHLWNKLKEQSSLHGVTPSVVILSAYSKILGMWSQSAQYSLNLTLFNRQPLHPDIHLLVGEFTSVLVFGVDLARAESFADYAQRIQRQLAEDMDHRYYSGVNVVRDLGHKWGKSPYESVLPVVFTSAISSESSMVFGGGDNFFGKVETQSQTPQVYLDHQVYEEGDDLILSLDAIEELFPNKMLDDLFHVYIKYLEELALHSERWSSLDGGLLPEKQLERRTTYNRTEAQLSEVPDEMLYSRFVKHAIQKPGNAGIITSARTLTYGEILNGASFIAASLKAQGARPNELIAVSMEKCWEQIVVVLGVVMAGAAYVCIDPALPKARQEYVMEHSSVRFIFAQRLLKGLPPGITCCVVDETILQEQVKIVETDASPDDLAYVLYTSGSTGLPKGVSISHLGALNTILDINHKFEIHEKDRILALSSLSFDLSVYDIFGILLAGGAIVIPDPSTERNPAHWLEMMKRHKVTIWNSVPSLMEMLVETVEAMRCSIQLRTVLMSGDWIPLHLPERIWRLGPATEIISLGGATEASIWSIYHPLRYIDSSWSSIPYGKPLSNQKFYVLHPDLSDCPEWVTGELYIGGAGVALNYFGDQEKTKRSFVQHPVTGERIYRTGDLGRFHPEGHIEFLGREDFQIKLGGFRIELGEIESVIHQHPKVRRAVVKKVLGKEGNASLASYLVLHSAVESEDMAKQGGDDFGRNMSQELRDDSFITDKQERILFKLSHKGLRAPEMLMRESGETGEHTIMLEAQPFDHDDYIKRSSSRRFLDTQVSLRTLSSFLGCLQGREVGDAERFRYGSAGHLYPVQVYLCIKDNKVAGLSGGTYYYHPLDHTLIPLRTSKEMNGDLHVIENRMIYESAAFTIFLIGKLPAIEPLYGKRSRDYCLIEAGLIIQLLETSGIQNEIGVCQIGALTDERRVPELLALDSDHILLHTLLAGGVDYADPLRGVPTEAKDNLPIESFPERVEEEIRKYCTQKLPHYMVPSSFTFMDRLPLTPVGKVDLKALPEPAIERPTDQGNTNPAMNEMEALIHRIFFAKSGMNAQLDVHKSFLELGIDSLTITRAWREIVQETGIQFPVVRVFEKPTIASLAAFLMQQDAESQSKLLVNEAIADTAVSEKAAKQRQALINRSKRR
ncbi:amino acid adenylation domain-containing protein [Paenibacillus sp. FSL R7-269]|uniref:non-ribosomal peptide synthetase n=1 Tax=Paenibacillus sp. FSL R7-269 TaxID=1226755 RepID=UPI0003E21152|nr:non-ribosomal peptide synthetase [Paenibacillus sp. FSL R7-269]ETT49792.1 amino acid adenylation domain-containing protein [Paenibacillus sp. FSL R7-269]